MTTYHTSNATRRIIRVRYAGSMQALCAESGIHQSQLSRALSDKHEDGFTPSMIVRLCAVVNADDARAVLSSYMRDLAPDRLASKLFDTSGQLRATPHDESDEMRVLKWIEANISKDPDLRALLRSLGTVWGVLPSASPRVAENDQDGYSTTSTTQPDLDRPTKD